MSCLLLRSCFQKLIKQLFSRYIEVITVIRTNMTEDLDRLTGLLSQLDEDLSEYGDNNRMNEKFFA